MQQAVAEFKHNNWKRDVGKSLLLFVFRKTNNILWWVKRRMFYSSNRMCYFAHKEQNSIDKTGILGDKKCINDKHCKPKNQKSSYLWNNLYKGVQHYTGKKHEWYLKRMKMVWVIWNVVVEMSWTEKVKKVEIFLRTEINTKESKGKEKKMDRR